MEQKTSGRALVVGGDSLVGSALQVHCRKLGLTVDASSRRAEARQAPGAIFLDLGDPDFTPLQGSRYDVAFVCAAVTNMALSPVMVADVDEAAERLAAGRHRGVWHLGSSDDIGYFDAARLMAEMRHLPLSLVQGEALTETQVPEIYRHRYVTLSCEKIARTLPMPVRRARDILDA